LGGIPLIVWSINAAKGINEICDILVSTDDSAIAEISRNAGALVPWLRPAKLATDTATSADVCLHALDWYETAKGEVDGLLLLQPTSPFRSRDTMLRGIKLFHEHQRRPVLGVSPATFHPMWCFQVEGDTLLPFMKGEGFCLRSQDLRPAYTANGAIYLVTPEHLRNSGSFYGDNMVPLVMDKPEECIDIDSAWDWMIAEAALNSQGLPESAQPAVSIKRK